MNRIINIQDIYDKKIKEKWDPYLEVLMSYYNEYVELKLKIAFCTTIISNKDMKFLGEADEEKLSSAIIRDSLEILLKYVQEHLELTNNNLFVPMQDLDTILNKFLDEVLSNLEEKYKDIL